MKNALLVPGVFFVSFFGALIAFSILGGLVLRYDVLIEGTASASFLLLCMAQKVCSVLPLAVILAIIGVYAFMMRHRTKLSVAVSLFAVCAIFTITVIMPACYAQMPSIKDALAGYHTSPSTDAALTSFLDKPFFVATLVQAVETLSSDIYAIYTASFAKYLLLISAVFFCISSFWVVCTATRWNLLNLLLLFLLSGVFLLLYSSMKYPVFQTVLHNLHLDTRQNGQGISVTLAVVAVCFHCAGGLKVLLKTLKQQKRSAV